MGLSYARRSSALRVPHSGRRTGGIELEHYFEKARELPKGIRRISPGKDRPLWQARRAAVAPKRWDRAEPVENRSCNREREKVSRSAKRFRNSRCLPLDLRWRRTDPESLANIGCCTCAHR